MIHESGSIPSRKSHLGNRKYRCVSPLVERRHTPVLWASQPLLICPSHTEPLAMFTDQTDELTDTLTVLPTLQWHLESNPAQPLPLEVPGLAKLLRWKLNSSLSPLNCPPSSVPHLSQGVTLNPFIIQKRFSVQLLYSRPVLGTREEVVTQGRWSPCPLRL